MKLAVSIALTLPSPEAGFPYLEGVRRTIDVLDRVYPGATLILHHDETVPLEIVQAAGIAIKWPRNTGCTCMFWRFTSIDHPEFDAVLVRDADSVVNEREAAAVREWMASDKTIHTMHDHPHHRPTRIMAGMWGAKRGAFPFDFPHLVKWWIERKSPFKYDSDQWFLSRFVYPYSEKWGMNHWGIDCSGINTLPFPTGPYPDKGYVGERITP